MANPSTLYRFKLSVSDVDRGFYEDLDFRVAMHPSETAAYLLSRVLAYALNYESGLEFTVGLCDSDEPALKLQGPNGVALWMDIGNPSVRRLHKAAKASERVRVYTYKNPENLKHDAQGSYIHRADQIEIFAIDESFLGALTDQLRRDNSWTLMHNDGELVVTVGEEVLMTTLTKHRLFGSI